MKTTMTIKIDKELKAQAQRTAKQIGIPLSTLINAYLREISATGRVQFTTTEDLDDVQTIRNRQSTKEKPLSYDDALTELQVDGTI